MPISPTVRPLHRNMYRLNLIEYGDYTCPSCRKFQDVLTSILPLFKEEVSYTFRHFPALSQPSALLLARAAEAARRQDNYWPVHQALFAQSLPVSLPAILMLAQEAGLDLDRFMADFQDDDLKELIWADMKEGRSVGVETTPTLFLNTRLIHGKLTEARVVPLLRRYIGHAQE